MTKHTKGPWKVFKATGNDLVFIGVGDETGEGVLDAGFGVWRDGTEAMANAHLAAAAPELLEALENALDLYLNYAEYKIDEIALTRDKMAAAIAKAKGENQ